MAQPIDFGSSQKSGLDELSGAGVVSMNVYTDTRGTVRRRPGLVPYAPATSEPVDPEGISGIFITDDSKILAIGAGKKRWVYEIGPHGIRQLTIPLPGTKRPVFAQTEGLVVIAGGAEMLKYDRASGQASLLGGSPPKASHVVASNLRLLGNDLVVDRTKVRFSDIGTADSSGYEDWTATNPVTAGSFSAESKPDPILAIGENSNEIFVWGSNSIQTFAPDPTFGFAPTGTNEYGLGAPYSTVKADRQFFWLDQYRRFVMGDARSLNDVSGDISATLEGIDSIDDCFGYRVVLGNVDAVVWTFPADGRSFVFQKGSAWAQWASFGTNWLPFKVTAAVYNPADGATVVGTSDGRVARFSMAATSDLGETVNAQAVTGYLDRDTDQKKYCRCVRLALRRGTVTGSTGPHAWLGWRDRPGPWEGRVPVDLGRSGDREIVVEVRSLGVYRRRQWMFEFNGTEELVLVRASEDFEVADQ